MMVVKIGRILTVFFSMKPYMVCLAIIFRFFVFLIILVITCHCTIVGNSADDILRLKKRFIQRKEEESRVFFAKRQTRLNQQREVCMLQLCYLLNF
jgi:hypothetical protein